MHLRISQAIFKPQGEKVCKSTFKVKPKLVSHESTSSFTVLPPCPAQSWGSPALSVDVILMARVEAAPFDNQIIAGNSCSERPSFSHFPNIFPVRPFSLSLTYPRSPARRVSVGESGQVRPYPDGWRSCRSDNVLRKKRLTTVTFKWSPVVTLSSQVRYSISFLKRRPVQAQPMVRSVGWLPPSVSGKS